MVRKGQSDETIEVVEERLDVRKAERPRERVVVRIIPVERQESVDVELGEEHVEVERIEVNRPIDSVPPIREERGVVIIPVVAEVLVLEKRLVLREELHVHRRQEQRRENRQVTLRSNEVQIDRETLSDASDTTEGGGSWRAH
jgi:stress response protein YsnF